MFEIDENDSKRVKREKEIRKGILIFLMNVEKQFATIDDLMSHLNISRHTIDKHLAFLSGANLMNTERNVYYITEEGRAQVTPEGQEKEES